MKKTATIKVKLVNADATKRDLDVNYRDANVVESDFDGPYKLEYGGTPKTVTVTVDANGHGAVDWITEPRKPGDKGDSGGKRALEDGDPVEVQLKPSSTS